MYLKFSHYYYNIIFTTMENTILNIEKNIEKIFKMLEDQEKRLQTLEKNGVSNNNDIDIREIITQSFDSELDVNFIKECLEKNNIKDDILILKKIYFSGEPASHSLRYYNDKKIEYWSNGKWNYDSNYLIDTLVKNIHATYLLTNNFDNYDDDVDQFMKNQTYIMEIYTDKYKERLLKLLITTLNHASKNKI